MTVEMLFSTSMRPEISDFVIPLRMTLRILARKMQITQYRGLFSCPLAQYLIMSLCSESNNIQNSDMK